MEWVFRARALQVPPSKQHARADDGYAIVLIDIRKPVDRSSEFCRFICMPEGMSDQTPAEDDIDRQLRELTEGRADSARYREPSAAERAKAAEQSRKQAKKREREATRQNRRTARLPGAVGAARRHCPGP